jgi:hypothetical protein
MKKGLLVRISIFMLLIASLAIAGIASADVGGACVEQAFQCDGPNGPTIMDSCGKTVCDVCPHDSLGYRTMCVNNTPNSQMPGNYTAQASNNFFTYIMDLPRIAMGQPLPGASVPSTSDRVQAIITLIVLLMLLIALLNILILIIKAILKRFSTAGETMSAARPAYPQTSRIRKKEPGHDFCTTPEHSHNANRRKKA